MPIENGQLPNSVQSHINNRPGHRTEVTEAVSIRNGKGKKTIRVRKNNKVTEKAIKLKQGEIKNIMGKKFMPSLSAKALKRVLSVGGTATNTSPNLFEENHKALRLTRRRKN